jgi:hypothetical protein
MQAGGAPLAEAWIDGLRPSLFARTEIVLGQMQKLRKCGREIPHFFCAPQGCSGTHPVGKDDFV